MIASAAEVPAASCFDGSDCALSAFVLDGKERVGESAASACSRSLRLRSSPIDEAVALTAPIDSSVSAEMEEIDVEVDIVASVPAGTSVRPCRLARCESSSGEREAMVDGGRTVKLTVLIDRRVACVGMKLGALFSPSEAEVKTPASSPASFADSARRIGDASRAEPVGGPTVVGESKAATSAMSSCGGKDELESCSAASSPARSATPATVGNPAIRAASEIPSPVERTPS